MRAQMLQFEPQSPATGTELAPELLDLNHLGHQTLGDAELRAVILRLFLDEAPRYALNIGAAKDAKDWRMAVHTLKGVALNIGAFRLAQLCKRYEHADPQGTTTEIATTAAVLADMIAQTCARIRQVSPAS